MPAAFDDPPFDAPSGTRSLQFGVMHCAASTAGGVRGASARLTQQAMHNSREPPSLHISDIKHFCMQKINNQF